MGGRKLQIHTYKWKEWARNLLLINRRRVVFLDMLKRSLADLMIAFAHPHAEEFLKKINPEKVY